MSKTAIHNSVSNPKLTDRLLPDHELAAVAGGVKWEPKNPKQAIGYAIGSAVASTIHPM